MNKIFKNRPSQRVFIFFSKKHLDCLLPWTWARSRANIFFKNKLLRVHTKKLRREIKKKFARKNNTKYFEKNICPGPGPGPGQSRPIVKKLGPYKFCPGPGP